MRSRILSRLSGGRPLLASLFVLLVIGFSSKGSCSANTQGETTWTEKFLARAHVYQVSRNRNIQKYLEELMAKLMARVERASKNQSQANLDQDYIAIGDAAHWLGHISEDLDDLDRSEEYHRLSLHYYQMSTITNSERINNLNCIEHAEDHLKRVQELAKMAPEERRARREAKYAGYDRLASQSIARALQPYISGLLSSTEPNGIREGDETIRGICTRIIELQGIQ